ncbi:MAG: hypothetical protein ACRD4S_15165 [Candidatus Acidiferrales bacterium]
MSGLENNREDEPQSDRKTPSDADAILRELFDEGTLARAREEERKWREEPKKRYEIMVRPSRAEAPETAAIAPPEATPTAIPRKPRARLVSARRDKRAAAADFERHSRKCVICHHADRESIEEESLNWHSPSRITTHYELHDYRCVYRHARAAGLCVLRRHNLRAAFELIIEQAEKVTPTADAIIRAVRACTCLTGDGQPTLQWVEPARHVKISVSHAPAIPERAPAQKAKSRPRRKK